MPFDFSWKNLIFGPGNHLLKFVLNASVNWVKTPDLLKLWVYTQQDNCALCNSPGCSLHHILCNCDVALQQRRYNWRHDSVLKRILVAVKERIVSAKTVSTSHRKIVFVKRGEQPPKVKCIRKAQSLLDCASDWQVGADFDHHQFQFPLSSAVLPSALT